MIQLANHFQSDDTRRHSEWLRQQQWFIKAKEQQERREKAEDKLDDDMVAFASEVVMATEARIAEFTTKLDTYDEATVAALMENRKALDLVNERLEALLDRAYVIEDGRRVFKTEDGTQVFDEFGTEVGSDKIDPDMIGAEHTTWEEYLPDFEAQQKLLVEQKALVDYQAKLDDAREQTADGEISEADLDDLDAELEGLMPQAVREHLDIQPTTPAVEQSSALTTSPRNAAISDMQSPTLPGYVGPNIGYTPGG